MASSQAHPRSRGENGDLFAGAPTVEGSSPLTRGKLGVRLSAERVVGLIPAHAGKTLQGNTAEELTAAHPRSRGENVAKAYTDAVAAGSSPLTRGKPLRVRSARND